MNIPTELLKQKNINPLQKLILGLILETPPFIMKLAGGYDLTSGETIQLEESAPVVEEETKAAPVVVEELINTKDVLNFIFPAIDTSQLYDYFYCVNRLEPEVTKSKLIELLSNNMTPVKAMLNYPEAYKDNSAYLNAFNSINDYSPEEAIEIIEAEQETTEQDKKVIMMNDHQKEIDENQKWFEELQAME